MDFPATVLEPCVLIHPWSLESLGSILSAMNGNTFSSPQSAVYPVANTAYFFPFYVGKTITALNLIWLNGTTSSGNIDVGIYSSDGTRLVSAGSTAQGTVSQDQSVSISLEFGPGLFYLAIVMDNTTGTFQRGKANASTLTQVMSAMGAAQMASAFPLPATATLAALTTDYVPFFGLSIRSFV